MEKQKLDLRERVFARGMDYPSDAELLMLVLGSGTRELPVEDMAYKMSGVLDVSGRDNLVDNLLKISGVGLSKALSVAAALELGRRRSAFINARVQKPSDILPYISNFAYKQTEHFIVVSLSGAHEILNQKVIAVGNSSLAIVHPREVYFEAVRRRASAVIVAHNHPSGDPNPSGEDIRTTERLLNGAELLGLSLLDHIIVSREKYFSFMEHGLLEKTAF